MSRRGETRNLQPTARQREFIALVSEGLTNRAIGDKVGMSETGVKRNLKRIFDKIGVWSRLELALWYEAHQ